MKGQVKAIDWLAWSLATGFSFGLWAKDGASIDSLKYFPAAAAVCLARRRTEWAKLSETLIRALVLLLSFSLDHTFTFLFIIINNIQVLYHKFAIII